MVHPAPNGIHPSDASSATLDPMAAPHCAYILLAEFDIDTGSTLRHQYPCPTGTDEGCAMLFVIEGAGKRVQRVERESARG